MARKADKVDVVITMGSDSDWPIVEHTASTLDEFGVAYEVHVASAHRTPERVTALATGAAKRGVKVMISAAGSAAHLGGVIAAHTTLPVIGIPVGGSAFGGMDSMLSTVQMPAGIPVATVAVGKAGAVNAALLAVQIMSLADAKLRRKFAAHKQGLKRKVDKGNARIQALLEASSG